MKEIGKKMYYRIEDVFWGEYCCWCAWLFFYEQGGRPGYGFMTGLRYSNIGLNHLGVSFTLKIYGVWEVKIKKYIWKCSESGNKPMVVSWMKGTFIISQFPRGISKLAKA